MDSEELVTRLGLGIRLGLGEISSLETVNNLQVELQKYEGGDEPSKRDVHL